MVHRSEKKGEASLYERLLSVGFVPEQKLEDRITLSVKENHAIYKLTLNEKRPVVEFCIDGYIVKTGPRCDKLILVDNLAIEPSWKEVFLELKGTDILRAVKQLETTIENVLFQHPSNKELFSRVVGSAFPSNGSRNSLEKAKIEFKKKYNCELKTLKPSQPDRLVV